jgi:hypothetical protein
VGRAKKNREVDTLSSRQFQANVREAAEPLVIRGLVRDWPAVRAALAGDQALADYLTEQSTPDKIWFIDGPPEIEGRFHYNCDVSGLNFSRNELPLPTFLKKLLTASNDERPHTLAAQGVELAKTMPRFASENSMPLLDPSIAPRAWIGNHTRVAAHHDSQENVVCVVAGRRRFTLFAPDQLRNLYIGPFHFTPAGVAVSMVDFAAPDFKRYPRFREALKQAIVFDLEPGDALYIPYHWYHHVQAFGPLTMLVNYWWNDASRVGGSPWDALMHGLMALRSLPSDQRRAWHAMFEHYVFLSNGDPGEHLAPAARGILAATGDTELREMRRKLIEHLGREEHGSSGKGVPPTAKKEAPSSTRANYSLNVRYGQSNS